MRSRAPQIVRKFLAGLASILLPCSIPAEDASSAPVIDDASAATESWFRDYFSPTEQGVLSFTTRTSNEIAQQGVDLTVPLRIAPDRSRALLSTLAFDHRDNGSNHFSMGLGYGFLIPDADIALRTRFHFDVGDTAFDNQVNRIAGGFDLFSGSGLDLIGNWYLPVSGVDPMRYYAKPFAQAHSILQNFVGVDERGMRGGDLKIEFDVPGLDSFLPTRAFFGGYHYDGKFAGDVEGFHGGITVHPSDSFFVGTEYYGDDEFFGDHWVFTAGMSMPLEGLFRADSWREQFRAVFSGGSDRARLTGSERLRSKMLGRVDRRNWVMTELSDPFTFWTDTLRDDVIFVNNGSAAGNGIAAGSGAAGAGTAEDPVSAIQTGAERLGALFNGRGIVYVQGGGPAYDSPLDTNIEVGHGAAPGVESVHFLSSFTGFVGSGGRALGGDTARPLIPAGGFDIRGGSFGATNLAKVEGFAIRGGITNDPPNVATPPGSGISSLDVPTFHAADNDIRGSVSQGIVVYNDSVGSATVRLSNNRVKGANSNGITILHERPEGVDLLVTGNRLLNNGEEGFGINLAVGTAPAGSRVEVSDNVISANGFNGGKLIIDNTGSGPVTALVAGNRFLNNVEDGLNAAVGDDAIDLTVRDNRFSGNSSHGMNLTVDSDNGDSSNLVVTGNDFLDNTLNGLDLHLDVEDDGENTTLIESNLFARNGADGLYLDVDQDDAETVVITISGNQFLSNGDDSIELQSPGGDDLLRFRSTLDNVSRRAGSGLALRDSSTGGTEGELLINGNTVNFPNPGDVAD